MKDFFGPTFSKIARAQLQLADTWEVGSMASTIQVVNDEKLDATLDSGDYASFLGNLAHEISDTVRLPQGLWFVELYQDRAHVARKAGFVVLTPKQQELVRAEVHA